MIDMKFFLIALIILVLFGTIETKSNLTIDVFFNYTSFRGLSLSPNGQNLLIFTKRPAWNSNSFENSLWVYQTAEGRKKLITDQLFEGVQFRWSPSGDWVAFLTKGKSVPHTSWRYRYGSKIDFNVEQNIYLYSIKSAQVKSIPIGNDIPTAIAWSQNDSSLYYTAINLNSTDDSEWKDVIRYRSNPTTIIRRINTDDQPEKPTLTTDIANVPFLITELLYSSITDKLIFNSVSNVIETTDNLQIYSIDLHNVSAIVKLTEDSPSKTNLQLTEDGKTVLFQTVATGSTEGSANLTQQRLYSIDLTTNVIERWVSDFSGNVVDYTIKSNGGVYVLGQLRTNVQIYSQTSPKTDPILHAGFNGSYMLISSSPSTNFVAFVFSSFSKAQEAYLIREISQLKSAEPITTENSGYDQYDLTEGQIYEWTNKEDNRTIEGILHYPPGKFQEKNLPLLVLIHGGPGGASLNCFLGDWYNWAPLAATQGWLVLEPNYRGSTGYGDRFSNEIRFQPLTRPEKDILLGVDSLIQDGIADRSKLAIGGYSYGGILTNWLITQTTQFNAALSGAGSIEHVSFWGMTDIPVYIADLLGGLPWEIPGIYQNQSAIYHFDRIRTPTHIVAGTDDVRVPVSQSIMFERALQYLGVPSQLLLLPGEGHPLAGNHWHGKIKVQEEIQWLQLYGYNSTKIVTP